MSTPQSTICICSGVRLDSRYTHSIYFADASAQQEYFAGKVVKTFPAYSYLRKSWPIQVEATMEQAKTWSYLYFRNGSGKYYYYFITRIEYKNDNMVELNLELDVLQTYLFDFTLMDCFVERQHTETDQPGEHTIEENLELGELIDNTVTDWADLESHCILVLASFNPNYTGTTKPVPALSGLYDGVFSGLKVWAVNSSDWAAWGNQLDDLAEAGFLDGILSMWMYPKNLVTLGGENTWSDTDLCKTVSGCKAGGSVLTLPGRPTTLNGYTPRNKKLLAYPFNFIYASNNMGGSAVYRYERFNDPTAPAFTCKGALSPDGNVKMAPQQYNGVTGLESAEMGLALNHEQGLTLGNFPSCAWDADVYKMWLAQNQNQHKLTEVTGAVSIAGGAIMALSGNVLGAGGALGGLQMIASHLAQKADMQVQPPQSRGNFSSTVNMSMGKHTFTFYNKSVTAEQAKVLDDFFTMYGYKINRVQKPNIHARSSFTYVKTIGCTIRGAMCNEDVVAIENIFDRGVTFWCNGDKIADYTQANITTT